MELANRAIETTATILLPEETDIDEKEWLQYASQNSAFGFLKEPQEDIYTASDGKPFNDKR
ncbi:MAG: hypothetical protein ABIK27_00950 [Bacteroidota bacterium]